MDIVERVHVAPVGYEYDRLVIPATEGRADRIHLLEHDEPESLKPDYHEDIRADLAEAGIEIERHTVDLFDVYDVLAVVTTIAHVHAEDDVRVNVATGSKVSAIGATIACMTTGATPYYVHPEEYATTDEPVGYGVRETERLPTYPIDGPTREQVVVLKYLSENAKVNKKELIELGEDRELPFIVNSRASTDKSKFRVLDSKIVDPLESDRYVEVEKVGRQKRISLTESGRNVLHGFRHLLDDRDLDRWDPR
ncbi:hypothetical protein BRD00_10750 [Halobacteriales archaeon QS_8_69_26]|nr:MAG: hypothetical protein BRD00_10750 [Halobacteriales archaeon QS_8_69_26]